MTYMFYLFQRFIPNKVFSVNILSKQYMKFQIDQNIRILTTRIMKIMARKLLIPIIPIIPTEYQLLYFHYTFKPILPYIDNFLWLGLFQRHTNPKDMFLYHLYNRQIEQIIYLQIQHYVDLHNKYIPLTVTDLSQ